MKKKQVVRLNESQLKRVVNETVHKILNESYAAINTVEDLCGLVGCSIENQEEAQLKIEQILNLGIITGFNSN